MACVFLIFDSEINITIIIAIETKMVKECSIIVIMIMEETFKKIMKLIFIVSIIVIASMEFMANS